MSKPFRDSSSGVGLDVIVTLPAPVVERIEAQATERGETVAGWCRGEFIALVEAPGSDSRIRTVLETATGEERRAAADRLTDADWERLAKGVELSPADLEAAAETDLRGALNRGFEEMERRAREPDPDQ